MLPDWKCPSHRATTDVRAFADKANSFVQAENIRFNPFLANFDSLKNVG
jgi:hypothetical protein